MPKLYLRILTDATPSRGVEGCDIEGYDIEVAWMVTENDGSVRGHGVTDQRGLVDIADPNVAWLQDPDNIIAFIPSHYVLRVGCEVPGRSTLQIRRALPFAVEEYVAADIESMHIAHAGIRAGEPVQCNVIARQQLQNWLNSFASIGVKVGYLIADSELLPTDEQTACLVFEEASVLVAHDNQAAVIHRANLGFALAGLDIEKLTCIGGELTDLETGQAQNSLQVEDVALDEFGLIGYLAERFQTKPPYINLLQGEYLADRPRSQNFEKWQQVLALAAVWLVVAFLGMVAQGFWAASEAHRLEAASYAFYKEMFPSESQPKSIDQLRRWMGAKLGQKSSTGSTSDFLGLVAEVARALGKTATVTSLSYAGQRGQLNVEVLMKNYDQIDTLKETLAANGVAMETTNAEQEEGRVRSRITVRYAG